MKKKYEQPKVEDIELAEDVMDFAGAMNSSAGQMFEDLFDFDETGI